jgi:hypothetical protein
VNLWCVYQFGGGKSMTWLEKINREIYSDLLNYAGRVGD